MALNRFSSAQCAARVVYLTEAQKVEREVPGVNIKRKPYYTGQCLCDIKKGKNFC
jgi:hypothetical protein